MNYQHINLEYLEKMAAGDLPTEIDLLTLLIEDLDVKIPELAKLVELGDWAGVKTLSHYLKSTFSYVGNEQLTQATKQLEQIAKSDSPDLDQCRPLMNDIQMRLPKVKKELADSLQQRKNENKL